MPRVPPTTAIDMDAGQSPCCDADLVLSSPPNVYECRECTRQYDTDMDAEPRSESESEPDPDADTCEVVMDNGEVCGRELPCRYHS